MTTATILLVAVFAFIAWRSPRHGVFVILATLPSYLIRFSIGSIPTTMLETMIWMLFIVTLLRVLPSLLKRWEPDCRQAGWRELFLATSNSLNPSFQEGNTFRRLIIPTALLFLAATISVFTSPDLRSALGAWKGYFVDPLLFIVVLLSIPPFGTRGPTAIPPLRIRGGEEGLDSPDSNPPQPSLILREGIVNALALCALIVSLAVIIQWLTNIGIPLPWDIERRATGLFPYPNANGLLLAPIAVLVIASGTKWNEAISRHACPAGRLLRRSTPRNDRFPSLRSVWYLVVALLSLLAMVLTKSEAGLLAAAVGIAAAIFFPLPRRGKMKMGVLTVAVAAVVLLAAPNSKLITDKLLLRDWSGVVRRHTWSETFAMLRDRPLLGAGLAGYPIVFAPYHTTRDAIEIFQYPHNIVLNFWSETGLLGLAAFVWLCISVIARRERSERRSNLEIASVAPLPRNDGTAIAAKLALLTLLIHGLVDVPYFKNDLAILFWALIIIPFLKGGNEGELLRNDSQPRQ